MKVVIIEVPLRRESKRLYLHVCALVIACFSFYHFIFKKIIYSNGLNFFFIKSDILKKGCYTINRTILDTNFIFELIIKAL